MFIPKKSKKYTDRNLSEKSPKTGIDSYYILPTNGGKVIKIDEVTNSGPLEYYRIHTYYPTLLGIDPEMDIQLCSSIIDFEREEIIKKNEKSRLELFLKNFGINELSFYELNASFDEIRDVSSIELLIELNQIILDETGHISMPSTMNPHYH